MRFVQACQASESNLNSSFSARHRVSGIPWRVDFTRLKFRQSA